MSTARASHPPQDFKKRSDFFFFFKLTPFSLCYSSSEHFWSLHAAPNPKIEIFHRINYSDDSFSNKLNSIGEDDFNAVIYFKFERDYCMLRV